MAEQADMDLHLTSLKDMITCPICTDIPDDHVTLTCFHSFCTACVAKLPTNQEAETAGINCPMCRSFSSREDMVTNDPLVQQLLNRYKTIEQSHREGHTCKPCGKAGGVWRCIDCDVYLCDTCQAGHTNLPVCVDHRVVHIHKDEDVLQADPKVFCQKHPKKLLEYNCVTCNKAICEHCHALEHGKHEFTEIEDGVATAIPKVQRELEAVAKRKTTADKIVGTLAKKLNALQANEAEMDQLIQRHTQEMIARISAEGEALRSELKAQSAARIKRVQFEKEDMEYNSASMESMIGWSKNVINNTRGASLLQELYDRIIPRLRTTLGEEEPKLVPLDPTVPVFKSIQIQPNAGPLVGKIDVQNTTFIERLSFRKSVIPFDVIAGQVVRHTSTFKVNKDCYRLCYHNGVFWLPSPSNNQLMLYSATGNAHSTVTLNRMSRPRAVCTLTNDTVIIACENGLMVILTNDYESDDSNGCRLQKGDYCDVYVDGETIYALEYGKNRVDIFEPDNRHGWQKMSSFNLQEQTNHRDRVLVSDSEIFIGSSLRGDVTVYDKQGTLVRSLGEQIEQFQGSNTLLCAHDMKQQMLVLDNRSGRFQVANTAKAFNLEQMEVAVPWDVCFVPPNTMYVLSNNTTNMAYVHTFKLG